MSRRSPELEQAERIIVSLQKVLAEHRKPFDFSVLEGCGDNSCIVKRPSGMATNGGCRCEQHELRRAVQAYRAEAERLRSALADAEARGAEPWEMLAEYLSETTTALEPSFHGKGGWSLDITDDGKFITGEGGSTLPLTLAKLCSKLGLLKEGK